MTQTNSCNGFSAGSQRGNVAQDPNLSSDKRLVAQWFDTTAFAQPATLTFGNQGVGIVRAPGLVDFDASLARTFRIASASTPKYVANFQCGQPYELRTSSFNVWLALV
jgi:hypothetical protein